MYARRSVVPALYTLLQWPVPSAPGGDGGTAAGVGCRTLSDEKGAYVSVLGDSRTFGWCVYFDLRTLGLPFEGFESLVEVGEEGGRSQVKVTPLVGRPVPYSNSNCID